jgi:two-component system CheB/CheR fusion protein
VIPPGKHLQMENGTLRLGEMDWVSGRRVAIDRFFRTQAQARGPHVAGVVLSGTGADGTLGLILQL